MVKPASAFTSNGDFEIFEYDEVLDVNVPLFWNIENHVFVTDNLLPKDPNWQIEMPLEAASGSYFLVLSTDGNDVNHAQASQAITLRPLQTISGFFFFGTTNSIDSNSTGIIKLIPDVNTLSEITVLEVNINQIGDFNSMQEWGYFEYFVEPNQAGDYQVILYAADFNDSNGASYFCVDGLDSTYTLLNGDFEFFEYDEVADSNLPSFWDTNNNVSVANHLIPQPFGGDTRNWKIDPLIGLPPAQGNYLLELDTGDILIGQSKAAQIVTVNEGESISGFYFFGTADYMNYNDGALIRLNPITENNRGIDLVYVDVSMVGDYSSMEGWKRFDYTFDANETGTYKLEITVFDVIDFKHTSFFCVDGLTICDTAYSGDIYLDCKVDFTDFALFANDWQIDCSGTDFAHDPNYNCYRGTDINGNGMVDTEDLAIFVDNWLAGCD
ncbi:MAG: hypothetical protein WCZ89_00640 [Phycisphaerae bacterium]